MASPVNMGKTRKPGKGGRQCKTQELDSRFEPETVTSNDLAGRATGWYKPGVQQPASTMMNIGRYADGKMLRRRGY